MDISDDRILLLIVLAVSILFIALGAFKGSTEHLERAAHISTILLFLSAFIGYIFLFPPIQQNKKLNEENAKLELENSEIKQISRKLSEYKSRNEHGVKSRVYYEFASNITDHYWGIVGEKEKYLSKREKFQRRKENLEKTKKNIVEKNEDALEADRLTPYALIDYALKLKFGAWWWEDVKKIPAEKLPNYTEALSLIRKHVENNKYHLGKTGFDYKSMFSEYDKEIYKVTKYSKDRKKRNLPTDKNLDFDEFLNKMKDDVAGRFSKKIINYEYDVADRTVNYLTENVENIMSQK